MKDKRMFSVGMTMLMVGAMLLAIPAIPNRAAEVTGSDTTRVLIFHDGRNLDGLLSQGGISVMEDYGTQILANANPRAISLLDAYDVYYETMSYRIGIGGYSFDTASGEPDLPANLRLTEYSGGSGYYIIQMMGPVKAEWVSALETDGLRVVEYLNNYAVIAEAAPAQFQAASGLYFVNWAGLYQPAYKMGADLEAQEIHISLFRGEDLFQTVQALNEMGVFIQDAADANVGGIIHAIAHADVLDSIALMRQVAMIQSRGSTGLANDVATRVLQSGQATTTGARVIFDRGLHGQNQLITMCDTGVDMNHEAFNDPSNPIGPSHRKVHEYFYISGQGDNIDGHSHGTHVAGTILGDAPATLGGTNWYTYNQRDGHAFASRLFVIDIERGGGLYIPANYDELWNPSYSAGSRISSNSWGTSGGTMGSYPAQARQLDDYVWRNPDYTFVWAAGNDGGGAKTLLYQPQAKSIIVVGGTENGASAINMYTASSRGPTEDNRLAPHIIAPAVNIYSARLNTQDYYTKTGTSMATPAVAGNVAIIRQYLEEGWYPLGVKGSGDPITNPSTALLKGLITLSGKEIAGTGAYANSQAFYPNSQQGWGRVYMDDILHFEGQAKKLKFWDDPAALSTGGSWSEKFIVEDSSVPLRVMLTWSDYPAAAGSNPAIVNDLDLTVTDSSGNVYRGNVFTGQNPGRSTTGGSYDRLNTMEGVILLSGLPTGEYTISINAHNVPSGPQKFAVAVLGGIQVTPSSKGTVDIELDRYPREASVMVEVKDGDLNTDPDTIQTVSINIKSNADAVGKSMTLTESGPNTAVFHGTITISATASPSVLQVNAADVITATYVDADDGAGNFNVVLTDTAIVEGLPDAPGNFTVHHWGPGDMSSPTTETRYMRQDNVLGTTQTATQATAAFRAAGTGYWGMRVFRLSGSTETEITTQVSAIVSRGANGNGIQTATWNCPGISLGTGDSIIVRVYGNNADPPTTLRATFNTGALGATALDAGTWSVNYYTRRATAGINVDHYFDWGSNTYNSRIEGFTHSIMVPGNPLWHNTLNWTHTDVNVERYNIYRSDIQSGPWDATTLIDTVPVGTNTYCDVDKGQADTILWWYVVRAQNSFGEEEKNTNAVQEPGVSTAIYEIDLTGRSAGDWAFVSFPIGISGDIGTVLPNEAGGTQWDVAKWWDATARTWRSYRRGATTNTFTAVNNQMGFWLHLTANAGDQKLPTGVAGSYPSSPVVISLSAGWNMVGYPSATARAADVALTGTGATMVSVYQSTSPYIQDTTNLASVTMSHGKAYWVFVPSATTWTVSP